MIVVSVWGLMMVMLCFIDCRWVSLFLISSRLSVVMIVVLSSVRVVLVRVCI